MKGKIFFILGGALLLSVFAYTTYITPIEQAAAIERLEKDAYSMPNETELDIYLYRFVSEAEKYGIDVNHIFNKPFRFSFTDNTYGRAMAISWGMHNDEEVVVNVIRREWEMMPTNKRRYVMYHELAHDIFNLEHGSCKLMMPHVPANPSEETTENAIKGMFELAKSQQ